MQTDIKSIFRVPLLLALFISLGLCFGFITFKIMSFSRTVEVPSLTSLSMLEANEALSRAGLYLKIEGEEYDSMVPSGRIARQDLPPGSKVKEKRAIKVVVSKGPRVQSIPLLVNETLSNAESILIQKGLRIGRIINVHSDTAEKGTVIAQKPESDEKLTDLITVLVSMGPHDLSYFLPDFQNKNIEDVKDITDKMHLTVEYQGPGSLVKFQKPKPGTIVKNGDKLFLEMKEVTGYD